MIYSQRSKIQPFSVMNIFRQAKEKERQQEAVYHLEIGEPGLGTPKAVLEKIGEGLLSLDNSYTEAAGLPKLRDRIVTHYAQKYDVQISAEQIIVTQGSSGAFLLAFLALFDVGDRVGLAVPYYPAYKTILEVLGLEVVFLETGIDTNFQPTVDLLEKLDKPLKGLLLASPANPTGSIIPASDLMEIAHWSQRQGCHLICDELYHGLIYDKTEVPTVCSLSSQAIAINSFSKYFGMTGWRIGWMVVPKDLAPVIERLSQNFFLCPSAIGQEAAFHAFDSYEELDARCHLYEKNRSILRAAVQESGFTDLSSPDGAFYLYARIPEGFKTAQEFCTDFLKERGVAVTPGDDFDSQKGSQFIRFCFAQETKVIEAASTHLKEWVMEKKASF